MSQISDSAAIRLQRRLREPDLSGTKYSMLRKLGSGGMAEVYLVHDSELDRAVAFKVIDPIDFSNELNTRMIQEAKIIAQLEHPAIVPVHDSGVLPDGRMYYVMKYVQGDRLDVHAEKLRTFSDRLQAFQKICDAVGFAHSRGIIHRDLKPQNIMIGAFGDVQVMDWGLAKIVGASDVFTQKTRSDSDQTGAGMILGTPGYMSPEQASGAAAEINEKSDIYALGAILYFLLTLAAPNASFRPRQRNRSISRLLEGICLKAMAAKHQDRYENVGALTKDINSYLNGLPVTAYRENIFERSARWLSRNSFFVYLLLAYLLMRAILLIFRS